MLKNLFQNSARNVFRRSNKTNINSRFQARSSATSSPGNAKMSATGWVYESPNLAQYTALKGAMISICMRGLYVWNLVMLMGELAFFPFSLTDLLRGKKRC